jgi:hypothetical protein
MDRPVVAQKLPAEHASHAVASTSDWQVPALQLVQLEAAAAE